MTPLVWIFLAIISVLVLMIVLIGLVLRARCSKSSRQKAKFVRAGEQQNTLLKEDLVASRRGNNPDLIPETGQNYHNIKIKYYYITFLNDNPHVYADIDNQSGKLTKSFL